VLDLLSSHAKVKTRFFLNLNVLSKMIVKKTVLWLFGFYGIFVDLVQGQEPHLPPCNADAKAIFVYDRAQVPQEKEPEVLQEPQGDFQKIQESFHDQLSVLFQDFKEKKWQSTTEVLHKIVFDQKENFYKKIKEPLPPRPIDCGAL
jgi:hypothetical protein